MTVLYVEIIQYISGVHYPYNSLTKNCYLIQSGSVGLGEVFLNGQVPRYIYIMYHNFSYIPFINLSTFRTFATLFL